MKARAIFFDAADTLIHKWAMKTERFAWLCTRAGIPLPDDPALVAAAAATRERLFQDHRSRETSKTNWVEYDRIGLEVAGVNGDLVTLSEHLQRSTESQPETWITDSEALPLLEWLRGQGFRLVIVSNWKGNLVDVLRPTGLTGYFDGVLDSSVVGLRKPDPRIFMLACEVAGVEPGQAMHIGDSPGTDVEGALATGIRPVLLDAMGVFPDECPGPYAVPRIRQLSELPRVILNEKVFECP
jgi:FMN phosphatase YigB (HAD superfamily)